jgi:murein DD-endopeptidase MepM/ murein hydrolase activator NlpD
MDAWPGSAATSLANPGSYVTLIDCGTFSLKQYVELARRKLDELLPVRHQTLLLTLSAVLLILSVLQERPPVPDDRLVSAKQEKLAIRAREEASQATAFVPLGPPVEAAQRPDPRLFLTVAPGDNLSLLFKRAGLGATDVFRIANSSDEADVLADLYPGDQLAFELDDTRQLQSLELFKSPLESYLFTRSEGANFDFARISREPHVEVVYKEAEIRDSLFLAAQKGGISATMAMDLAGIFNGVIDFILDVQEGDTFEVLYEEEYLDGKFVGSGRILAATFTNVGKKFVALRYEAEDGTSNFFSPEGESMRKAFLQNPVDFTRISSGFSLARKHPILNTIRAHKGTDYAAPKGTPVVATADGRVTFASTNGSFGKLVVIQHGDRFETKYAHLNGYGKGIKQGARVRQGDVIGYVGATGSATGPHLHYEFLMDGVHRNSRTIHDQLPKAIKLSGSEMARFREQTQVLVSMLTTQGTSLVAGKDSAQER